MIGERQSSNLKQIYGNFHKIFVTYPAVLVADPET